MCLLHASLIYFYEPNMYVDFVFHNRKEIAPNDLRHGCGLEDSRLVYM